MDAKPVIAYLIAETICLMPKEDMNDIIEKHKAGTLEDPFPTAKVECYTLKTGRVEPEEVAVIKEEEEE